MSGWLRWVAVTLVVALIGAVVALFVNAGWPRVRDDFKQLTGPGDWRPTAADWRPVGQTYMRVGPGSSFQLTTPAGYMRWFGAYLPDPRLCDYQVALDARSSAESEVTTYGYGVAPGTTVDASSVPHGEAVQYDHAFGGLRYPDYPYDSADNQSGYIDPETDFLDGSHIPIDNQWHHWLIVVRGTTATVYLDGHQAHPLQLMAECAGGIYLRVWDGTADFRNITISKK